MAQPSDLVAEVVHAAEQAPEVATSRGAQQAVWAERRARAISLRIAGMTYEQIGAHLEITPEAAADLIRRTLTRAENKAADQLRSLENERLDRAQTAIWPKVISGDLKAVDTFLRLSARRARLNGIDAPTQINLSVSVRQEMEQALNQLQEIVLGEVLDVRTEDSS